MGIPQPALQTANCGDTPASNLQTVGIPLPALQPANCGVKPAPQPASHRDTPCPISWGDTQPAHQAASQGLPSPPSTPLARGLPSPPSTPLAMGVPSPPQPHHAPHPERVPGERAEAQSRPGDWKHPKNPPAPWYTPGAAAAGQGQPWGTAAGGWEGARQPPARRRALPRVAGPAPGAGRRWGGEGSAGRRRRGLEERPVPPYRQRQRRLGGATRPGSARLRAGAAGAAPSR